MRLVSPPLRLAALALACVGMLLCAGPARAGDLVGAESCRSCHLEAYRIWSQGPHARAADSLTPEQRRSPLCLYCHSRDEVRSGAAQVVSVSCETCHGGGRYYQPEVVMRDRELAHLFGLADLTAQNAASSCETCHGGETPSLQPFDVKAALARIDHWSADRAARKAHQTLNGAPHPARPSARLARWLRQTSPGSVQTSPGSVTVQTSPGSVRPRPALAQAGLAQAGLAQAGLAKGAP